MPKRNHLRLILTGAILIFLARDLAHSQQSAATAPVGYNSGARAPTAADTTFRADADGDGWDDFWLNLYDRGAELRGNPSGDFDGDGVSNMQEMRDFTNPRRKDRSVGVSLSASSAADRRTTATSNPTTPIPSTQFWRVIEVPPNPFGLP